MLTVVLEGESLLIDLDLFAEFTDAVKAIVDDAARLDRHRAVSFRLGGLHASSPTLSLEPVALIDDADAIEEVDRRIGEDLPRLESAGLLPEWMRTPTIERLYRFAASFGEGPADGMSFKTTQTTGRLTRETYRHLDAALHATTDAIGSVSGVLMTATLINGPHLTVHDSRHDVNVRCNVDRTLLRKAAGAIGSRIEVSGRLRRGIGGRPERLTATELEILEDDAGRPSVRDTVGLFEDGPDSVNWLREQRA